MSPTAPDDRMELQLRAFTARGPGPRTTFALVLAAVTVATVSMWIDAVPTYSGNAFPVGIGLTIVLAIAVAWALDRLAGSRFRPAAGLLLPTGAGALIGMVVQALVLADVGGAGGVKDLGGLIDTGEPIFWIGGGIVLGGLPALLIALFLFLAGRTLRRLTGHDAAEGFGVAYAGGAGVLASICLLFVDGSAVTPLVLVTVAAFLALLLAFLIDGGRIQMLRRIYAGEGGFDIVPAERFAADPSLAPLVAQAGADAVIVRVHASSYREAAAEPVAFVGADETSTLRPIRSRRFLAGAMLLVMTTLGGIAIVNVLGLTGLDLPDLREGVPRDKPSRGLSAR